MSESVGKAPIEQGSENLSKCLPPGALLTLQKDYPGMRVTHIQESRTPTFVITYNGKEITVHYGFGPNSSQEMLDSIRSKLGTAKQSEAYRPASQNPQITEMRNAEASETTKNLAEIYNIPAEFMTSVDSLSNVNGSLQVKLKQGTVARSEKKNFTGSEFTLHDLKGVYANGDGTFSLIKNKPTESNTNTVDLKFMAQNANQPNQAAQNQNPNAPRPSNAAPNYANQTQNAINQIFAPTPLQHTGDSVINQAADYWNNSGIDDRSKLMDNMAFLIQNYNSLTPEQKNRFYESAMSVVRQKGRDVDSMSFVGNQIQIIWRRNNFHPDISRLNNLSIQAIQNKDYATNARLGMQMQQLKNKQEVMQISASNWRQITQ